MKKIISLLCICTFFMGYTIPVSALTHRESDDYIKVSKTSKHLRSRLSKEYTGYVYTIENISKEPVVIENISTKDTLTGEAAYLSVKRSSLSTGAKTIGSGLAYAIPTLTLSLLGSIILAPIKMTANTCGNIGAKQEGGRYDKDSDIKELQPGESLKVKTIAVQHHSPEIDVLYRTGNSKDLTHFEF